MQRRGLLGVGVGDVLADDDRRRILGYLHPLRSVEFGRRRLRRREHQRELAVIQRQVGVTDVGGHAPRRHAGARKNLHTEIGGGAPCSGDPIGAVAADHREQVLAIGVGPADQPGGGAHVEEPRQSGSASTVSSEHSAVTREMTPNPSSSSRSFSASAATMFVISPIIFCTKAHASTVLGARALSFVTLRQLSVQSLLLGRFSYLSGSTGGSASWASWTREVSPSLV